MELFSEERSAQVVAGSFANTPDPRLNQLLTALVRHLHAFVKEVELTEEEWGAAVDFLTRTGQKCDDVRQEFVLLSDVLGVSMLVETINHRTGGTSTESTVLGPFHMVESPPRDLGENIALDGKGEPCLVTGRVTGTEGEPLAGALVDVWQANAEGFYDVQQPDVQPELNLRGLFTADDDGRFWFRTIVPRYYPIPDDGPVGRLLAATGRHPYRPAHVHFIVTAQGHRPVTTHLFVDDSPYLDSDAVFGVKESLVRQFPLVDDEARAARLGLPNPFRTVHFDVALLRGDQDRPTAESRQRGTAAMSAEKVRSLQDLVDSTPDLVDHLYNDTPGPHSRIRADLNPVPTEFSNWRDEQRAWRETAILFDQSHHMPELFVKGPDSFRLLNSIGVNSLANLNPGRAKQFIGCNARGQMIGDCILYDHGDQYELVSSMPLLNWVEYQAQAGDWDVTIERDNNTSDNPTGKRVKFRFQLDGPNASAIFDEIVEGDTPEIAFFRTAPVTIAGVDVLVLRHGMAGHKGVEISGPYEHRDTVRAAILRAGAEHGLRQGGTKAYFSTLYEQAWIAYPLPAVYTGEDLRAYREWLPADGWEAKFSIAGSFVSNDIEDYYVTPYDLGYGHIVAFDHDFIGREALEELAPHPPRQKMTLVWNTDDVLRIFGSLLEPGLPYKYLDLPVADYGNMIQRDEVRTLDGRLVGLSTYTGYSTNERKILSLALLDTEHAVPGEEVTLLWGEPDGGSRKPRVELHQQTLVRATVAPAPYAAAVRRLMRSSIESSTAR